MVIAYDANGFFAGDYPDDNPPDGTLYTDVACPQGFYLPRWNGFAWVEGKTAEEIAAIKAVTTTSEPTDAERITSLETTQSAVVDILADALGVTI